MNTFAPVLNRKQRRVQQSVQREPVVYLRGKFLKLAEAETLAAMEINAGSLQTAADIYDRIIHVFPRHHEAYNNRAVLLQELHRYEEALLSYTRAIELKSDFADAYANRGVILHKMGRHEEALENFNKALALRGNDAGTYNNLCLILQKLGRYEEALCGCERALSLRSDYSEAHYNKGVILQELGRYEEALASYGKAIAFKPGYADAYNNRGIILLKMMRHTEALAESDKALAIHPNHPETHFNRGLILHAMARREEALASYERAVTLKADFAEAHNSCGNVLQELQRYDEAIASYDRAISCRADYADAYNNIGNVLQEKKCYDEALAYYDKAIALKPDYAEAYNNRGVILLNKGAMPEAERMFQSALALKPHYPVPLYSLASMRRYRDAGHPDIGTIRSLLQTSDIPQSGRVYLYFALGKIYDDCALYDEAFECYSKANSIHNTTVFYNPRAITAANDATMEIFTEAFLAQRSAHGSNSTAPLFIVGMPRSGTTLAASVLSNHGSIGTAGELSTISELAMHLSLPPEDGRPYPYAARHITPAIASQLAQNYEKRLRHNAKPAVPHIIDKHPLNFRYLGLIAMLFPHARIIHCVRHPLDTGLSNYFQHFSSQYDYCFDLHNIGHFYTEYARIMEHWRKVLPVPIIEVRYEDMIASTRETTEGLLASLGLEWDERCLSPHTNRCTVETASRWQVRQPIYDRSVGRWRHYEKHLSPMREMLDRAGIDNR